MLARRDVMLDCLCAVTDIVEYCRLMVQVSVREWSSAIAVDSCILVLYRIARIGKAAGDQM